MAKEGFNMSESELLGLVKQVQDELANITGTTLAKSDEGSKKPEESAPVAESSAAPSAPASEPSAPPAAAPSAPAAEPAAPAADPSAPPADAGAPGADAGAAGPSFEELVTLYTQLPPEDFEAHAAAIQAAAQARSGAGAAGPGAPPSAPAPAPSAPAAAPSAPPSEPAFKSEARVKELEGTLAALTKSMNEQKQVIEALGQVVTMPRRKATTGVTFIPMQKTEETKPAQKKFEEMTKSELHESLKDMTKNPKLEKSSRELINAFYCGNVKREALADLFKEPKK